MSFKQHKKLEKNKAQRRSQVANKIMDMLEDELDIDINDMVMIFKKLLETYEEIHKEFNAKSS